jgi:hypothetical protein
MSLQAHERRLCNKKPYHVPAYYLRTYTHKYTHTCIKHQKCCVYMSIHTCRHTHNHAARSPTICLTYMHTYTQSCSETFFHLPAHYLHTNTHTYTHTCPTRTWLCIYVHTYMRTYTRRYPMTTQRVTIYVHTYMHTYTHRYPTTTQKVTQPGARRTA